MIGVGIVATLLVGGVAIASASGPKPKKKPAEAPADPVAPDPVEPPVDDDPVIPAEPIDPEALKFDLTTNWGGLPMSLRVWLARGELASGIPGLARALGVKWWQAFRAGKALVSTVEAAKIAAANPELARFFVNKGDAGASKKLLDTNIKNGVPKPKDYETFASGSWGLGDILGANFATAGLLTEGKKALPYINRDGKTLMQSYEGQLGAAISSIRNIIVAPKYSVLDGGINTNSGDSLQTWGNIFAAYAYPDAFAKGTQQALDAKARYLERALEIGIDLAEVAYPWPPGTVYKHPPWDFGGVVKKLEVYAKAPVSDGVQGLDDPSEPAPDPKPAPKPDIDPLKGYTIQRIPAKGAGRPIVWLLHGHFGNVNQLAPYLPDYDAEYVLISRGSSWIATPAASPEVVAKQLHNVAQLLQSDHSAINGDQKRPWCVVGYSQGGAVAYHMAANIGFTTPQLCVVAGARLPVTAEPHLGAYPSYDVPEVKGWTPTKIVAISGANDNTVPSAEAQAAAARFADAGFPVSFDTLPGVGHSLVTLGPPLRAALKQALEELLP